jgi:hypothetical protein
MKAAACVGLLGALVLPHGAAAAPLTEQQCLDRFRAETARIEREFAARRRGAAASAPGADQAWARDLHAALAKAADAGEACSREARKARR